MPHRDADKQLIQIPMGRGLDEGTPPFIAQGGQPTVVENARILKNGSVEVRRGYEAMTNTTLDGTSLKPVDCFSHDKQLLALESNQVSEWSEELGLWIRKDWAPEAQIDSVDVGFRATVSNLAGGQYPDCDAVQVGNYRIVSWHYHTSVAYYTCARIIDVTTNARSAISKYLLPVGVHGSRLVAIGSLVFLCYCSAANTVSARVLDCTSSATVQAGWSAATALCSDLNKPAIWECGRAGNNLVIAYNGTDVIGGPRGVMRRWDTALSAPADQYLTAYANNAYAVNGSGIDNSCICAYDDGRPVGAGILVSSTVLSTWALAADSVVIDGVTPLYVLAGGASRLERLGIAMHDNGSCRVVFSVRHNVAITSEAAVVYHEVTVATGAVTGSGTLYNFTLTGLPFSQSSGAYVYAPVMLAEKGHLYTYSIDETKKVRTEPLPRLQASAFLVELPLTGHDQTRAPRAVIRLCPYMAGKFGDAYNSMPHPPNTHNWAKDTYILAMPKQSDGSIDVDVGFDVYQFSFSKEIAFRRPCRIGQVTLLSGGVPTQWDGDMLTEVGFHYYPRMWQPVSSVAAGGSLVPSSVGPPAVTSIYSYRVVYVWMDSTGQKHESIPSVPISVTMGNTHNTNTLQIDTLTLTDRNDPISQCPVMIEIYRTLMIADPGSPPPGTYTPGTEYYFVGRIANDPTVGSVTYVDQLRDELLAPSYGAESNKLIPTAGGTIMGGCLGAVKQFITHDGRPWALLAEDPTQIAFGHVALPGRPPTFPDGWTLRCARGNAYTAIATSGEKIICFQRNAIDVIYGTGPNDFGVGGNYSDPQLLTESVGCTDPRRIVRFPGGHLFLGDAGAWTISDSLATAYVGLTIEDTLAAYPNCTRMVIDDAEKRVVLMLNNSTGTTGRLLAWYYTWNMWSVWKVYDIGGTISAPFSSCVWDKSGVRRIVYAASDSLMYMERDNTTYKDGDDSFIPLKIEFGWISLSGTQGWSHGWQIGLLGTYRSKTIILATVAYDYSTDASDIHTWDETQCAALLSGTRLQVAIAPQRPEHQSFKLTLVLSSQTAIASNTGAMTRLEALTIEHAPEAGLAMLSAGARK